MAEGSRPGIPNTRENGGEPRQVCAQTQSRIFVFFFVVVLVVTVSEAPAHTKYFDKCYEEHKDDRKDYRKAYNQIEIECEVCKCTLENAIWQNTF